jgi:hypothetical protein
MAGVISSIVPFPNLTWWLQVVQYEKVVFDLEEYYSKMSYRNRYYIPGANGLIQLSIPISEGRNVRKPVKDIAISNAERWQVQHWRTIVSVYKRTPYFEFYEPSLQPLFEQAYTSLAEFNIDSVNWLNKQLKIDIEIATQQSGEEHEIMISKPGTEKNTERTCFYTQIFQDRNGFLPNLSILDLLFSEGPHAIKKLVENKETVMKWMNINS